MHLGFATENYQIIYKKGNILKDSNWLKPLSPSEIKSRSDQFREYIDTFPDAINQNVWYDFKNALFFSQAQYRFGPAGKDHHFLEKKDAFIKDKTWGVNSAIKLAKFFDLIDDQTSKQTTQIYVNDEIIYGAHPNLQSVKDKSVLIVCGGPSASTVAWENLNYDQIWSCNQFFMNEKFATRKVDLVTVVAELFDFNNTEQFIKYIEDNNTLVSFELERGSWMTSDGRVGEEFKKTRDFCIKYKNSSTFFHTRYRGQLGVGLRLIVYAMMMGFKDIYIVGLDGRFEIEKNGNLLHAFETNKPIPNWYKKFGNDFQDRQMIIFWEYLMELKQNYHPNTNVYNLGQDSEYNVLARLFSDSYPLPDQIKEDIK